MGQIEIGRKLGFSVARAIGLPTENLVNFTLIFEPEQPVACRAEYYVTVDSGLNLTNILTKDFELTEK